MTDEDNTRRYEEKVAALRPLLTSEFLAALTELARTYGHSGDYTEIFYFVDWCYDKAGASRPPDPPAPYDFSKT